MKIILLYNWKKEEDHWMPIELKKIGYNVEIVDLPVSNENRRMKKIYKLSNLMINYKLAKRAVEIAEDGDIIISLSCTPGIFCSYLARGSKIKILALTLLIHQHNKNSIIEKLRNKFYEGAFKNKLFWTSCNSKLDIEKYESLFNLKEKKIFCLPDTIENIDSSKYQDIRNDDYVFAGGISERDWDTVIKVTDKLKNIKFKIVAKREDWKNSYPDLPNVETYFNVKSEVFDKLLMQSSIVLLPLKSEATAGLMVLFKAIQFKKIILATRTNSTKLFIDPKYHDSLLYTLGDYNDLSSKLENIHMLNPEELKEINMNLDNYIYSNFSIDAYMKKFKAIIEEIIEHN